MAESIFAFAASCDLNQTTGKKPLESKSLLGGKFADSSAESQEGENISLALLQMEMCLENVSGMDPMAVTV